MAKDQYSTAIRQLCEDRKKNLMTNKQAYMMTSPIDIKSTTYKAAAADEQDKTLSLDNARD